VYRIDLDDPRERYLDTRSGRWLMNRVSGLLTADTRLQRALAPDPEDPKKQQPRR
jgi:hypothetical protein